MHSLFIASCKTRVPGVLQAHLQKMNQKHTIREMLETERPYEKCCQRGPESLSDPELLAVILRTGTKGESVLDLSRRILEEAGGDGILGLHGLSGDRLRSIRGIGQVKSLQLLCILELSRRLAKASAGTRLDFASPASIAAYYMEDMRHLQQEHMKLLMLNTKSRLIGEKDIYKGTANASLVSPRELFIEALRAGAVSIILLHNHPSGDPTPSQADKAVTLRVRKAGEFIGIDLLDHIIIGNNCYISLLEEGLMYTKG